MDHMWVDINEYCYLTSVSLSTIRRRIKSRTVESILVEGKYLIKISKDLIKNSSPLMKENISLRNEIKNLKEELSELKMLITDYEKEHVVIERTPALPA